MCLSFVVCFFVVDCNVWGCDFLMFILFSHNLSCDTTYLISRCVLLTHFVAVDRVVGLRWLRFGDFIIV